MKTVYGNDAVTIHSKTEHSKILIAIKVKSDLVEMHRVGLFCVRDMVQADAETARLARIAGRPPLKWPRHTRPRLDGYQSIVNMGNPRKRLLNALSANAAILGDHRFSVVEVNKDELYCTRTEAEKAMAGVLMNAARRNRGHFEVVKNGVGKGPAHTLPGATTVYLHGSGKYKKDNVAWVCYVCRSKTRPGKYALHCEFRVKGAANIKRYLGLETITDFDGFNARQAYENLEKRFLMFGTPRYRALACKTLNIDGREKSLTQREKLNLGIAKKQLRQQVLSSLYRRDAEVDGRMICEAQTFKNLLKRLGIKQNIKRWYSVPV